MSGAYKITVRTLADNEPVGKYSLQMVALRDVEATQRQVRERRRVRQEAVEWLRARSIATPLPNLITTQTAMAPFDMVANRVRVLGLGEATHGSRELADLRLALTKRLVEKNGYRLITLELSAARVRDLQPYVQGTAPHTPEVAKLMNFGWFGRRSFGELVEWARTWNLGHPNDQVKLVGVDAQGFTASLDLLGSFLMRAYGEGIATRWNEAKAELQAADEQTWVFGNSDVATGARYFAIESYGRLRDDALILNRRFSPAEVRRVTDLARDLAQFADFNGGEQAASRTRDWYMALNILRALEEHGLESKAVYWAHNAHVATSSARYQPSGTVLRMALGCGYAGIGTTFGKGAFIAQIPGDPENDLAENELPAAGEETVDSAMADLEKGAAFSAWPCETGVREVPAWLAQPRPMRWVGGIFTPGGAPSTATRTFTLTSDFDGVFYLPEVTAEAIPADRPSISPRPRPATGTQ
jgi:erythromycin esterase